MRRWMTQWMMHGECLARRWSAGPPDGTHELDEALVEFIATLPDRVQKALADIGG